MNALNDLLNLRHDRGLQAFGGFIEQQKIGLLYDRSGDGELLLLPAAEYAALTVREVPQPREIIKHELGYPIGLRALSQQGQQEIFPDRKVRHDFPTLGHVRYAPPRSHVRLHVGDICSFEQNAARLWHNYAHDCPKQGRFARAVPAQDADHTPVGNIERDPVKDMAGAVEGVDALNLKRHRLFPCRDTLP